MSAGYIIDGERFEYALLSQVTVGDQIRLEHWLRTEGAEFTEARTWGQVIAIADEVDSLGDDDPDAPEGESGFDRQRRHPEFKLSLVVAIWAAKRKAGHKVTPGECAEFTWDQLDFFNDEPGAKGKG